MKAIARKCLRATLGTCLAVTIALPTPAAGDSHPRPDKPGPWAVGRQTFILVDPSRNDRELIVDAWYPIDHEHDHGPVTKYDLSVIVPTLLVPSTRARHEPPVSAAGPFPLLVHSHGNLDFRFGNWNLAETLASHGFLVVAPGHTGNTAEDGAAGTTDPPETVWRNRPRDVSFVISCMMRKNTDPSDPFFGRVSRQRIGVTGSSMGGGTALAVTGGYRDIPADVRVRAAIPLTPAAFDLTDVNFSTVRVPTLIMTGTEDFFHGLSHYSWRRIDPSDKYLVSLLRGWHGVGGMSCTVYEFMVDAGFSAEDIETYIDSVGGEICPDDLLCQSKGHRLMNLCAVSFMKLFLEGDDRYAPYLTHEYMQANERFVEEFLVGCASDGNGNGIPDDEDIRNGTSADENGNGVPDECESPVLYVKRDAVGQNHGTSWADAYTDLQSALRVAAAHRSGTVKEIWVAAGTYLPDVTGEARCRSFFLGDRVAMYGGFAGFEFEREQRDWVRNPTILSGDLAGDDDPDFGKREENSICIVQGLVLAEDSVLDGFTLSGANADRRILDMWGSAVSLLNGTLTIANCRFESNESNTGGALNLIGPGTVVTNCLFHGNRSRSDWAGGAILNGPYVYQSAPAISYCTFSDNVTGGGGGAVRDADASARLKHCILWGDVPREVVGGATVSFCDVQGGHAGPGNIDVDPSFVDPVGGDYRLASDSPCIDAGNPNQAPPGRDAGGSPRFLDGDLDQAMVVDMGAHEFDHVRLEISGNPTPGGTLTAEATGTNGMPAFLIVGTVRAEMMIEPFGACFIDPVYSWISIGPMHVPSSTDLPIPPAFPTPTDLVFQALGLAPPGGNLSNPVQLRIE